MVKILIAEGLIQPHRPRPSCRTSRTSTRASSTRRSTRATSTRLPYFWGTTGLGYNKAAAGGPVDSWEALFDPKNKGRILMLDDMREAFGVALKSMGQSLNDDRPRGRYARRPSC